jgi:hypothetical protein
MIRVKDWIRRYGPAELVGIATALLGSWLLYATTRNEVAAAYGGALGENLGFYAVMVGREMRAQRPHGPGAWARTAANLMIEFGPAEILDSGVIRPLAMGLGTHWLGRQWGVPLGKIAADITFYVPVIAIYELRRRLKRASL